MLKLLRQGKISKWFSGIGQEAIAVGTTLAMDHDEYLLPMHRNLGVFTTRGIPLDRLFKQWQGKLGGFTKGRDRSFHFGTQEFNIVGMISHLGPQLAVADGIALANKLKNNNKACLVFSGEGGTSEGDFHEALNVAAVWDLPVIFVIENNGYGLSTPTVEQFRCAQLSDRGIGYGIESKSIDGNNFLEVYHEVSAIREKVIKEQRPFLLECMTFRMRGHEEASGTKYVPKKLFEEWEPKDPVLNFEKYLENQGILSGEARLKMKLECQQLIKQGLDLAAEEGAIPVDLSHELSDVYEEQEQGMTSQPEGSRSNKRMVDAISDGLRQSMQRHDNLIIMGQDIAEYGGVFKITDGFVQEFGKERVRNTPICESAIVGAGLGLSINEYKSVVEMQFADFVTCGFNQIINNLAKSYYRWNQHADVVVRMPTGAGIAAGPFHSQSNEAWFFHTPGLKVVYPSTPYTAKGLLTSAIADTNPVMFFEHKALYRSVEEDIPDDYYELEIGKARTVQEGDDLTIITYGMAVHWVLNYLEDHPSISIELLDLQSLLPWDKEAVLHAVKKTGKVLIVHEDTITGGIGGEISAFISEFAFEHLDAPVMRCGSLDTPIPFSKDLEDQFLASARLGEKINQLLEY